MKSTATTAMPSPDDRQTLFDRFREAGLADRMVGEIERRLRKQKRRRRAVIRLTAVAAALIGALGWAVPYVRDTKTISIPTAERRSLVLADGSRAELNATTELKADFRYGRRIVRLERGEGFFSVVSDPSRPFFVETAAGTVRVTGTQFDVRVATDDRAEVTLVEGKVEVNRNERSTLNAQPSTLKLFPGQQLVFGAESELRTLSAEQMDRTLAWRQGKIVLDGMTLPDAAARFAEFHGRTIKIAPSVAGLRLGGTYSLEDLPRFLSALTETGTVRVDSNGDGSFRIVGR